MMDAQDFLESARLMIQGNDNKEVDYRNAASRAYYCAYHLCRQQLEKQPQLRVNIGSEHEKLVRDLLASPNKQLRILGKKLEEAKRLRHTADYKLNTLFSFTNARQTITHVCEITKTLTEMNSSSPK